MAKISRKTQQVFGSTAGGTGVSEFGSKAQGAPVFSTNLDVIQSTEFLQGWLGAVLAGTKRLPPYQDMNAVQFVQTTQLAYLFQEGIPEYDSGTEYHQNSIVKKSGTYELWGSVINTNAGNPLVEGANWTLLEDLQAALTLPSNIQTDNYLLTSSDTDKENMMNNAAAKAFTFPAGSEGSVYFCKNIGAGLTTLTPDGAETIEISTLETDESVILQYDAANTKWRVVAGKFNPITFVDTNVVNNQAIPASWTDVNLSAVVGTNECLAICRITSIGALCEILFRKKGETTSIGSVIAASSLGGGTSGASINTSNIAYITIKTDSSGIIQVQKGTIGSNYSLDVITYLK